MDKRLIKHAMEFAHAGFDAIEAKRKYTGDPYWVHTDAVAAIVAEHGGSDAQIAAAHLHDYKEDVVPALIKQGRDVEAARFEREYYLFPEDVRWLVIELTDVYTREAFPTVGRDARKALEAERISRISKAAKLVKLADLFDNSSTIVEHDKDFAKVYLREKERVLTGLHGVHPVLYARVVKQLKEGLDKLAQV